MFYRSANYFRLCFSFIIFIAVCGVSLSVAAAAPIKIAVFGDSLTSGYQLDPEAGFAPLLERLLKSKGYDVRVINASITGTTTTDALARLDKVLMMYPDIVIVQLGYNDFIKGLDIKEISYPNLHNIIAKIKIQKAGILLCGALAPAYLDPSYAKQVDSMYYTLMRTHKLSFYTDILAKTRGHASYNLADGLHPNSNGVKAIVYDIYPTVKRLVDWRIKYNAHKRSTQ